MTPFLNTRDRVEPMVEGIIVLELDDPSIRKGSSVSYSDGRGSISATVVRRRRQRDGSLKLWCEGIMRRH